MTGSCSPTRARRGAAFVLLSAGLLLLTPEASAVRTRQWTETVSRLERGDSSGVAVTSLGRLFLAPELSRLGGKDASRRGAHVWSVASDPRGGLYLGTGPEGRILKIDPSGGERLLFTVDEPMVTALAVLPGGDLLAGTAPEGRIYRIRPDGSGHVWSETGERYVWSIVVAADGAVYAGTGEQGVIFRLSRSGSAESFFDSDEPHIVSLLPRPDGGLLAGGAGRGLVYQVDAEGHAFVLHDDPLPEVRAMAVQEDGNVVAAMVAAPEPERRPPAVKIKLPDGVQVGPTSENLGDLEERPGSTLEGFIEGLALPDDKDGRRLRGRVVRITPGGEVTVLWRSETESPYCLALDADGRPVFGTGEPGRLYREEGEREVALLASLREAQVTGLERTGAYLVAATSNPASTYRLERDLSEVGTFLSRPFDAGGVARWGKIRWRFEGKDGGRVELYTRTGNSADPDATWSAWGPALAEPDGSPVVNPDGRFLQWRARLVGSSGSRSRISDVSVTYATYNRAPAIRDFRIHSRGEKESPGPLFRWSVSDPDGDPVTVRVEYREQGSSGEWSLAASRSPDPAASSDQEGSVNWKGDEVRWDTSAVEEGSYEVRAVSSDKAANHPGEGRQVTAGSTIHVRVDRSPPRIEARRTAGGYHVEVTDAHSPVSRLEVVGEDGVLFQARPLDGVCDSGQESFEFETGETGAGARLLRARDEAGNTAEYPLPPP